MAVKKYFYFDIYYAAELHDDIIQKSGGLAGANNLGLLESALQHVQNDLYYPELHHKLTHLVFAINKFHAFTDGNKRSSIALGAYLLKLNGYEFMMALLHQCSETLDAQSFSISGANEKSSLYKASTILVQQRRS